MNAVSDCAMCMLKLAYTSAGAVRASEPARLRAVRAALDVLAKTDFNRVPPTIAREVLTAVNRALDNPDPFAQIKKEHNRKAKEIVEKWAPGYMTDAADEDSRLLRAARVALAGNGMDLAAAPEQSEPERFEQWLEVPWAVDHGKEFIEAVRKARSIMYLLDNAGEIAFDAVLIRELIGRGKKVVASVKESPALNDATMEDAKQVGLSKAGHPGEIEIITTGQANMGVDLKNAPARWKDRFFGADMVIAKGQAHLESLHECGREVFFITLIKCSRVARYYRLEKGRAMLYKGGVENGDN